MAFYLNDIPAEPFTIEPPETIDITQFTEATAEIRMPYGSGWSGTVDAEIIDDIIVVTLVGSPFTVAGIYELRVVLSNLDLEDPKQRIPGIRIVAQDPDEQWHTLDSARDEWADAESLADVLLWNLLEVAKGEVIAYAPALPEGERVPDNYRLGQRMQARNRLNAAGVDPSGNLGTDDFQIRPFPLDWQIKQILRPKRGRPVVR